MLHELRVENLLLIERAELRLGPGLNVLTGETGAGKTVLAHALDLLLGGKPRPGIVRPGASEAYVEGVFALPDGAARALGDRLPEDAEEVVLARRVSAEGRTRAYLGGRSATAADLRDVGGALLSFYGQHEHRKLMLASAQLEILDGFCGRRAGRAAARRSRAAYARERELRARARGAAGARRRARPRAGPARVGARRRSSGAAPERGGGGRAGRRARAAAPRRGAARRRGRGRRARWRAARTGGGGASRRWPAPRGRSRRVARRRRRAGRAGRPRARARAWRPTTWRASCAATARASRRRPGRLDEVEERLALLDRLKRKHGGTIAAVLAHAEACRRRRDELAGAEEALEGAEARAGEAARAELARRAAALRDGARGGGAARWPSAVRERLAALAMEGATFEAALAPRDGFGPDAAATRSSS